jgi:hypothetical protein
MKSLAAAIVSSSMVAMRLRVSGPVSSTVWAPMPSAMLVITPRGRYFFWKSGSFG